ncbi:beta-galactosidase [Rhodanobacter panaciterrae]|uniref:Beta-galactosidase n=1 Tax=Rhodanobacter panaciterrae TaxID=490572 RepID=A0ABQ2ZKJ0_9GAMM|nr:beta-galactosidase [Rhodanobacter panaciterrae]GGY17628.1 beta-galactosidase [Rhodanobacter panaciterrae]
MQRREFLKLSLLAPSLAYMGPAIAANVLARRLDHVALPDGRPHRFELGKRQFLLNGLPFQIRSGEMHPIRIPVEYWRQRIRMAKAMGLNTIAIYLMWNSMESEPGVFDLSTGNRDFAKFIRLCQEEGMWVYLRPGPYVCGEWDLGGLPPYLLHHPHIRLRDKDDADYMVAVSRYIGKIAPVVKPLLAENGGPILMVQVENEYASFGHDLAYLKAVQALWQQNGIHGPFSIADGLGQVREARTYLPGAALGIDGDTDFAGAQAIAGELPVWMGEGYPGWITHWGKQEFSRGDFAGTLAKLMAEGRSFNMYVVHGGTNFGFSAGANVEDDQTQFQPVITSYDYGSPINEHGAPTADYHAFRKLIAAHLAQPLPELPPVPPMASFPTITPQPHASLWDNLPAAKQVQRPQANELLFAQDHGMVLYRRALKGGGELVLDGVRDYATVFHGGRYVDYVSRMQHPKLRAGNKLPLPAGGEASLEVLVDSFGHVNYGRAMADRKGLVGEVQLDGKPLQDWEAVSLPLDDAWLAALKPLNGKPARPGVFFKGVLSLAQSGDCYLDMADWAKGYLWVNGHLLGRYWNIGPQQRLYCPAPWLHAGDNEVLVFDLHRTEGAAIRSAASLSA